MTPNRKAAVDAFAMFPNMDLPKGMHPPVPVPDDTLDSFDEHVLSLSDVNYVALFKEALAQVQDVMFHVVSLSVDEVDGSDPKLCVEIVVLARKE